MAGKPKNQDRSGKPDMRGLFRLTGGGGHDLFRRTQVRDLTQNREDGNTRGLKGVNPVHTGFGLLMIAFGLLSITLVLLNMISNLWFASLTSMTGSLTVLVGVWMLYDAIKERKSLDNLVRDAIMRSLRDKN